MGTHPIFESDFDCLTEDKKCLKQATCATWQRPVHRRLPVPRSKSLSTENRSGSRLARPFSARANRPASKFRGSAITSDSRSLATVACVWSRWRKRVGRQKGCPGIPANHWTMSNTGYPCFFNTSRTDCAWCASGGAQCSNNEDKGPDSPAGSRCWDPEDSGYCDAVPGDCLHIHKCDSEAECKFSVKFGAFREHHTCQCKTRWTGNGQQCYDSKGVPSSESLSSGDVSLTMAVSNNYYVYPHNSSEFPTGPGETDLVNNITALFNAGASCAGGQTGCNGTFVNLVEAP